MLWIIKLEVQMYSTDVVLNRGSSNESVSSCRLTDIELSDSITPTRQIWFLVRGRRDDAEVNGSSCYIICRACQAVQMNELIMALGNVIRTLKDDAQGAHV